MQHVTFNEKIITVGPIVIAQWKAMTVDGLKKAHDITVSTGKSYDNKAYAYFIVPPSLPIPDSFVRAHMTKTMDTMLEACAALSVVIEGSGLKQAAQRSVAASFMLVSGRKLHVFATLEDGVKAFKLTDGPAAVETARRESMLSV